MRANRINTTTVPVDANGGPRAERREPGLGGADQPAGGPRALRVQSCARMYAPIWPPPCRKRSCSGALPAEALTGPP